MKALVIGGAGYIGSHVVSELIKNDHQVIVLDNLSTGNELAVSKKAKFYKGDQLNMDLLNKIFQENKIEIVFHFSAKLIVPESVEKPIEYFENNVYGVIQILKAMNANNIKNIIFSSTAAVYGDSKMEGSIKENSFKNPMQPYGQSKLSCEWLIEGAHKAHGINYAIFRYFNVAGADSSYEIGQSTKGVKELTHLVPVIMEVATGKRKILGVYGNDYNTKDGSCVRDYIHVTDLAQAHIKGALYTLEGNSGTFNLGSNYGFSVLEVLQAAKQVTNTKIPHKIKKRRIGDPAKLIANNTKSKKLLNWEPSLSLKKMIKSDFEWRKNKKF